MRITEQVRRLIAQGAGEELVREAAIEGGMVPLAEDGLAKVKAGITTADELLRVLTQIREARATCPECGGDVGVDFKVCPRCSHRLTGGCHKCGRALQPDYCPYARPPRTERGKGPKSTKPWTCQRRMSRNSRTGRWLPRG